MQRLKKFLVVGVMALTVISMCVVAVPNVGATASAGDLIKMNGLSSVYFLGADGKRYVFPNEKTYSSWYSDFSGVVTIPQAELEAYALGGNVTVRPGTKLVKITTNPTVYAVEPGGTLRAIASEANAITLYGADWAKRVIDVPDAFFTNYKIGTALAAGVYPVGSLVKNSGGADVYYYDGTNYRKIANEVAFTGNKFDFSNVVTSTATITAGGTAIVSAESTLTDTSSGSGGTAGAGTGLTVALASNTPASATIPSSSTGVVFTKFNLTASQDGAVIIDTIKVKRSGVGAYNDLTGVYLYDGEARLTNAKTISSDTNEAEFSALNLTIAAGTTKTLSVVANVGASKTGNHAISISASSAVVTNGAAVSGSFPITGNIMALSSTNAGTATIDPVNTGLTNPTLGDIGTAVASFKLTATEDGYFKAVTLKQDGTITTSLLSNYKLYQGTTEVPVTASVNSRKVALTLNTPFKLLNGSAKIFTVKADVSASAETTKNIVFFMDTAADLLVTSDAYGFGLSSVITPYDTAGESKTLTLQGGSVTIANTSAAAHDVKTDTTSVELAKVNITSSSDTIEVQKMTVQILTTKAITGGHDYGTYYDANDDGNYDAGVETLLLRNIKIKDAVTGQTLASSKAITDADGFVAGSTDVDTTLTFTWTDYFTVSKGATRTLLVIADVNSAQVSGVVHTAKLDFSSGTFTAKDSQDKTVTDVVPASLISGNPVTTKTSSLTVSLASSPETRTVVKGSTVDALGLIFAAGSGTGNDVKVSALTLDAYVDQNVDGTFAPAIEGTVNAKDLVQQVELYVDGVKIAGPVSVDSSGQAVFTSSKFVGGYYTVNAGTNKTVIVRAVASTNAPFGGTDDAFSFSFNPATDLTAEDANGAVTAGANAEINDATPTTPTVSIRVTGSGTIATAVDNGRPDAQVVIAGVASEQELSRVKLIATKENFVVDKLTAQVDEAGSYDDVSYLKLYTLGDTPLSSNVSLDSNGEAAFSGLTITVVKGTDTILVIKGKLNPIEERTTATDGTAGVGADTGDGLTVSIETTAGKFNATGVSSSFVDTSADVAVGNIMVVRKTKPAVAMASLPVTTLANGTAVLYKFTVAADANNDVVFKAIQPDMTLNDSDSQGELVIATSTVYLYDVTSGETLLNTVGVNVSALIPIDDSKIVTIGKGTNKTFEIRGTVAGVETGDSINIKVTKDTAALSSTTETAADAITDAQNNFIWSDKSADTNGVGSVEWINSYLLTNWPTSVATLTK
ncbi:MAG: hypothetical protein V1649_04255 [Patescibacteria group bacterium]